MYGSKLQNPQPCLSILETWVILSALTFCSVQEIGAFQVNY